MKSILNKDSIRKFKELLDKNEKIVLTCHVRPDGDAIGSTLGLYHLLNVLGKQPSVVIPDRIPQSLKFLPGSNQIAVYTQHDPYCTRLVEEAGLIIMCDFNTAKRQEQLAPLIQGAKCAKVLIDHHQEPDIPCDVMFSYPHMSSTCELVFRIIAELGYYTAIDHAAATCLLTGMITDTHNFTVNCGDPEIYEIMQRLLEREVDKSQIIYESMKATSLYALRLNAFAISERLEIFENHHCALVTLTRNDLEEFNYQPGDTEGLVTEILRIRGVIYSVFMREDKNMIKVSMRSRDEFPVSEICKDLYDGGGHRMASGGEFYGTLSDCRQRLIDHMKDYDSYIPRKYPKIS